MYIEVLGSDPTSSHALSNPFGLGFLSPVCSGQIRQEGLKEEKKLFTILFSKGLLVYLSLFPISRPALLIFGLIIHLFLQKELSH